MLRLLKLTAPHLVAIFASIVFIDSLRFKFTNAPETQVIFGKLDAWATSLGVPGLFSQTGLFSQYVIGTAELVASALLLLGLIPALRRLQGLGALLAFAGLGWRWLEWHGWGCPGVYHICNIYFLVYVS